MIWERMKWSVALLGGVLVVGGCATIDDTLGTNFAGDNKEDSSQVGEAEKKDKVETETTDSSAEFALPEYNGVKHAIGVIPSTNRSRWRGGYDLGNNLTIMMQSALSDSGRFVVVEREQLGDILQEQDFLNSGRMAQASGVAQTGKLRPARYLATVEITTVETNTSGGGVRGGVRIPGTSTRVGGGGRGSESTIVIVAKLMDTTTGEVKTKSITGKSSNKSRNIRVSTRFGSLGGNEFEKEPIGIAAQDCINQAVYYLAKQLEEVPVTGTVAAVANNKVIINRGSDHNFQAGMKLELVEQGEAIMDPVTGGFLDYLEGKKLGEITIESVRNKLAYCTVDSGTSNPPVGTLARLLE
jgi:curli biogenesis system outer membrane secretion channel CsgG